MSKYITCKVYITNCEPPNFLELCQHFGFRIVSFWVQPIKKTVAELSQESAGAVGDGESQVLRSERRRTRIVSTFSVHGFSDFFMAWKKTSFFSFNIFVSTFSVQGLWKIAVSGIKVTLIVRRRSALLSGQRHRSEVNSTNLGWYHAGRDDFIMTSGFLKNWSGSLVDPPIRRLPEAWWLVLSLFLLRRMNSMRAPLLWQAESCR